MLKVLIVDDEPKAREGLREFIPWEEYGFSICGEGVDGQDALEKIAALNPDLVLIDIRMPGMYGIDVMKYACEKGFKGKFIVLTGFSDFEYARNSLRLGVRSYILKPIDEEELTEAVKNARQEILKENQLKKKVESSDRFLKSITLSNIILGIEKPDDFESEDRLNGLFKSCRNFQVALIHGRSFLESSGVGEEILSGISELLNTSDNVDVVGIDKNAALLIKNTSPQQSSKILERLYKRIGKSINMEVSIALGRLVDEADNIPQSYRDAVKLLELGFFQDEIKVVSWDAVTSKLGLDTHEPGSMEISDYTEELFTFIEVNDKEKVTEVLNGLILYFVRSGYSMDKIKGIAINICVELKEKITANYSGIKDEVPSCDAILQNIYEKANLYALMNYLNEVFCSISDKACNDSADSVIKRILNYIDKNYYKSLRLEGLGEIFNYNSAYLGKIFKSYTGDNFNNYLDKVRIENAKILLSQKSMKIYEVSEKVGYSSMNYFYEKFKKNVGVSPKEFKKVL
ncbi:MAG: response regulator transcription factor [Bacillota bacterium]|nr:response regulator transcription factor [Bacillota bacterium]